MTLVEVVDCAPFRLPQPRGLTPYEWTVVRTALEQGYSDAGRFAQGGAERAQIDTLFGAVRGQGSCPRWRTSMFGPAPAVAPFAYECLGAWFSTLDPLSQRRAIADIFGANLLCRDPAPWAACPLGKNAIGRGERDMWEGAAQMGVLFSGAEPCAWPRTRTSYTPMKGREMLEMFRAVGGTLPPSLEQAAQFGAAFVNRDFLVGIQVRKGSPELSRAIAQATDMITAARLAIEDIALIWAPGRGGSIKFMLDGQLDPTKLAALIQSMMPDLLTDLIPQLPAMLPNLPAMLPNLVPWLFPTQGQIMPFAGLGAFGATDGGQPGTPPTTGVTVVDVTGSELPTDKPPIDRLETLKTPRGMALVLGAAAAVLTTAFIVGIMRN